VSSTRHREEWRSERRAIANHPRASLQRRILLVANVFLDLKTCKHPNPERCMRRLRTTHHPWLACPCPRFARHGFDEADRKHTDDASDNQAEERERGKFRIESCGAFSLRGSF
jgi:hypothetical protein